jgi:hypothetical protein
MLRIYKNEKVEPYLFGLYDTTQSKYLLSKEYSEIVKMFNINDCKSDYKFKILIDTDNKFYLLTTDDNCIYDENENSNRTYKLKIKVCYIIEACYYIVKNKKRQYFLKFNKNFIFIDIVDYDDFFHANIFINFFKSYHKNHNRLTKINNVI